MIEKEHVQQYMDFGGLLHVSKVESHALNLVLHLCVELPEAVKILLRSVPVPAPVRFEERPHHVAEPTGPVPLAIAR